MKKFLKSIIICLIIAFFALTLCGCEEENMNNKKNNNAINGSSNKNTSRTNNSNNTNTEMNIEEIDFVSLAKEQFKSPEKGETIAILHIKDYGDITVKFFANKAPKAVENFITHAKNGYYNGVIFHRVINNFMIQGGDPTGTGAGGESIWNKEFEDEFSYDLVPYRGALCMANSGSNTNGSQFFIEQAKYDEDTYNMLKQYGYPEKLLEAYKVYGGSMHLFLAHTVFGQVISGMDVVDKIASAKTNANNNKPVNDIIIESIEIREY